MKRFSSRFFHRLKLYWSAIIVKGIITTFLFPDIIGQFSFINRWFLSLTFALERNKRFSIGPSDIGHIFSLVLLHSNGNAIAKTQLGWNCSFLFVHGIERAFDLQA